MILLLCAASNVALAAEPGRQAHEVRHARATQQDTKELTATKEQSEITRTSADQPKKKKRCRTYYKTVGIACRSASSR